MKRLCALYGVTRAGYYAWRSRGLSAHQEQDLRLVETIGRIFKAHRGRYGSPRVHRELVKLGLSVSRRRVARLMRQAGLRARVGRIYRSNPRLHQFFTKHPNRLWRTEAKAPDQVWVGDITYLSVAGRWRYLAVVMDQYSRRVLGWSLARTRTAELPRAAFDHAVRRRRPAPGLIFHSDRGSEFAATLWHARLEALGVRQSMARAGTPADNAHMESFFHSFKADVVHGVTFATDRQLRHCLRSYVRYYNYRRLHSSLGYLSPVEYERQVA